ncbi:MAG: DUF512 domain-containing protein [Candidatus Zixiibacteriota bacterium]|nr:MAG: DUF512 domain-containing protein [candidate division Zixibacteria bacterium]
MRVKSVDPQSPLFGYIRPGYTVKSINGQSVLDAIDFQFRTAGEEVAIVFVGPRGKETSFTLDTDAGDPGLTFEDDRVLVCRNKCIFCFVHQQPNSMRRALYVKDEDYRLSFTHGNFVTLSHIGESEIKRIISQRLSPLYVSVHATDDQLRGRMLGSRSARAILPLLRRLVEGGINIHTQVVLCPGINDGDHLRQTIDALAELYPGVGSLAVVPVGLTKYRKNLPKLRKYKPSETLAILVELKGHQRKFLKQLGSRFIWPADEFYVETNRPFPTKGSYEDMPQFENGVGMAREFITTFNRRRSSLRGLKSGRRVLFLTGRAAYPFLKSEIFPYVRQTLGLKLDLQAVDNRFWGAMVTVSGLLTGKDLLREARYHGNHFHFVVLPPNCLNQDGLFLDDMSIDEFRRRLPKPVVVGKYDLAETLKEVFV